MYGLPFRPCYFACMTKLESVAMDFQIIQRVLLESLQVTGYQVEASNLSVEPHKEKWIVMLTVVVDR